ncbi:hypothetical protein Hanom_Chr05g00426681 [Helianthus anomalus]
MYLCSYVCVYLMSNLSFNVKQGLKHLATYRKTHKDKDGNWVDTVTEQNFNARLWAEMNMMEKTVVLNRQMRFPRFRMCWVIDEDGMGDWAKPSSNMPSNVLGAQPQTPQPFSEGKQAVIDDDDIFDKDDEDDDDY